MAFQGIDLRDLYRPGFGLSARRAWVLVRHLPHDAPLWAVLDAEEEEELEQPKQAAPEEIRSRADFYKQLAADQSVGQS